MLEALYEVDRRRDAEPDTSEMSAKAVRLVTGVLQRREELDQLISEVSDGWRVERMPVVDRAVLRLGLYELIYEPSTPVGVIVDEAVRLAKRYSTGESGGFVNGVLSTLAIRHRAQPTEEE